MKTPKATRLPVRVPPPAPYGSSRIQTTGVGYSISVWSSPTSNIAASLRR